MSQQGLRQASVRAVTGTTLTYEGDFHALFTAAGIPVGDFNGRFLQWINAKLSASYTSLPEAMQALAASAGAYNFASMGTFDASTSAPTEVPENTGLPTATGFATAGQTIGGSNGSWDQPPITGYTYQHQVSDTGVGAGTDIVGATSATYQLISGQVGKYFRRGVKAANIVGPAADFAYSAYIGPIVAAPSITLVPDTTGTEGAAYSAGVPERTGGRGDGTWYLNGSLGASNLGFDFDTGELSSPSLGPADTYGPFDIFYADDDGVTSNTIGPFPVEVAEAGGVPVNTTPPSYTGTMDPGQTLTGDDGIWTNSPTSYNRQWYRDGSPIASATASTYVLTANDSPGLGTTITYGVAGVNGSGAGDEEVSAGADVFHPLQLSPHFFFDAENLAGITQSGGVVSAWASMASDGAVLSQASVSQRPAYNATGLNGRPCVTGDGADDTLRNSALTGLWPATSVPSVIRGVVSQPTAASTTGFRYIFGYGNTGGSTVRARLLYRTVDTGVNRFVADAGTSGANVASVNASVDFTGVHSVLGNFGSTAIQANVDGIAGPSVAAVPATISLQGALFARPTDTASNFSAVSINHLGSYPATLTADELTSLDRWEAARKVP